VLGTRYLFFVTGGIYRRVWRYATTADELVIAAACGLSALLAWAIVHVLKGPSELPVSVFVLDAIVCTLLVGGSRLVFRLWVERAENRAAEGHVARVLIVGAGRSGRSFAREVRETPGRRVVGFIDDNPAIQGRRIVGTRVLGSLGDAARVVGQSAPTEVVVTITRISEESLTPVMEACEEAQVPCRLLRRQIEAVTLAPKVSAE
jgi:FlaA1/EpsC-like NDP-sugar epimerase